MINYFNKVKRAKNIKAIRSARIAAAQQVYRNTFAKVEEAYEYIRANQWMHASYVYSDACEILGIQKTMDGHSFVNKLWLGFISKEAAVKQLIAIKA